MFFTAKLRADLWGSWDFWEGNTLFRVYDGTTTACFCNLTLHGGISKEHC